MMIEDWVGITIVSASLEAYLFRMPTALQIKALSTYFESYPLLPHLPFKWDFQQQALVKLSGKWRRMAWLVWVFLFGILFGVVWSSYLLWLEFASKDDTVEKIGLKKSLFIVVYLVGTANSVACAIGLVKNAKEICSAYRMVAAFEEYIEEEAHTKKNPRKLDIVGVLASMTANNFTSCAYFLPGIIVYFDMDPMSEFLNGVELSPTSAIGYVMRLIMTYGWMMDISRIIGCVALLMGCTLFQMLNDCSESLRRIPLARAPKLYRVCCKFAYGVNKFSSYLLGIGIYSGVLLASICYYATIQLLPRVESFSLVYLTFPAVALTTTVAFLGLPLGVKFPEVSAELLWKWKRDVKLLKGSFQGRILKRELASFAPISFGVGDFNFIDRDTVTNVLSAIIDQTTNLVVSFPIS